MKYPARLHLGIGLLALLGSACSEADTPAECMAVDCADGSDLVDSGFPDAGAGEADAAVGDAGVEADAGAADAGPPVERDLGLSTDPADLAAAAAYEQLAWEAHEGLRAQLLDPFGDNLRADEDSGNYSSGWGFAAYQMLDEAIALSFLIDVTAVEARRDEYADIAHEFIETLLPALLEGRGTVEAGCPASANLYGCSHGNFRYLDAGHGAGAIGFLMNAIWEHGSLRARYMDDLTRWATALVPLLERHYRITESTEATMSPHMPAKIAAGHLAVWKVLGDTRYRDAFVRVTEILARSTEAENPIADWVGSDPNHAQVSVAVMNIAYREHLRGNLPDILTTAHMTGPGEHYGEALENWTFNGDNYITGSMVALHGVHVGFSPMMAARVDDTYDLSGGSGWALGIRFDTVAGIAMGHATAR